MNKIIYTILLSWILFSMNELRAQIPINDPSWVLQPDGVNGGTEEFNSSSLNSSKWNIYNNQASYWGAEYLYSSNLSFTGTSIKIKLDTLSTHVHEAPSKWANPISAGVTYVYQGAAIESKLQGGVHVYKFGYLEIEAIVPTGVYSLWPAFWVWSADCGIPYINEIDIVENNGAQSKNGTVIGTNTHFYDPAGSCLDYSTTSNGLEILGLPNLSSTWHKYAVQWAPDRIIWYFDDNPIRSIFDPSGNLVTQFAMDVVLNMAADPWYAKYLPSDWNTFTHCSSCTPTNWPQYFEINYLRYYKLGVDCATNLTICFPTDYDRKVKKSIITNNGCTPTFNPSTSNASFTLRATDFVTLDAGTIINPSGSGYFAIEIMPCPN